MSTSIGNNLTGSIYNNIVNRGLQVPGSDNAQPVTILFPPSEDTQSQTAKNVAKLTKSASLQGFHAENPESMRLLKLLSSNEQMLMASRVVVSQGSASLQLAAKNYTAEKAAVNKTGNSGEISPGLIGTNSKTDQGSKTNSSGIQKSGYTPPQANYTVETKPNTALFPETSSDTTMSGWNSYTLTDLMGASSQE
jgi:hypothetical protein